MCILTSTIFGCNPFSLGGINTIYLANKSDITGVYFDNDDLEQSTVLSLAPTTATWYPFQCNSFATGNEETMVPSLFGNYYTQKFQTVILGLTPDKRKTLEQLTRSEVVIVFQDANEVWWILGEGYKGLKLDTYKGKTGINADDPSSYTIEWNLQTKFKLRSISSVFVNAYIVDDGSVAPIACTCEQLLAGTLEDVQFCTLDSLQDCPLQ